MRRTRDSGELLPGDCLAPNRRGKQAGIRHLEKTSI
jgi:hypothetical protein